MKPLKDYCLNITDGEHGSIKDDSNGEYYFLNNNNITDNGIVIRNNDRKMSKSEFDRIHKRTQLNTGDVVIATCGTIGKTQVIKDKDINYDFSRSVGIIKCDTTKLLPEFLHYYFKNPDTQKQIARISEGAVQKHFYIGAMENFEVEIPDISTQNNIIDCLSCIDSKIQNNYAICSELESLATLIYTYWFIQFDFPDENGNSYKSSGGKMIWNEELKREIPKGWEVKTLKELAKSGKTVKYTNNDNKPTIDMSVMPSDTAILSELNDSTNFKTNLYEMKCGDILFGSIRPYLHKAGIAPCDGVFAGTIHNFRPINESDYNFLLFTLCNSRMFDYAVSRSQGTKMPVVSYDSLAEYKVPYNEEVVSKFNDIDFKSIVSHCVMENQELAKLRDFLLPMLMNGQVKIKEPEVKYIKTCGGIKDPIIDSIKPLILDKNEIKEN